MCTELPMLTDFEEKMRFLACGQMYRCVCNYCNEVYQSDIWHGCSAMMNDGMSRNEASYQAYRAKMGTRDNWVGD